MTPTRRAAIAALSALACALGPAGCGEGDRASGASSSRSTVAVGGAAPASAGQDQAESSHDGAGDPPATDRPAASRPARAAPIGAGQATRDAAAAPEAPPSVPLGADAGARQAREDAVLAEAKRALADPRFGEFRSLASGYVAVVREMRPLDRKFADGTISEEERAAYWKLDARKTAAWGQLHAIMFEERFSKADRKAMGQWIALSAARDSD